MTHQRRIIATGTERFADGRPAFRQVVVEEPRQQGKSVSILSLMVTRGLAAPGTMISYSAQTRQAGRRRMLDVWWPRIKRSRGLRKVIEPRRAFGAEAFMVANRSMIMPGWRDSASDARAPVEL